MSKPKLGRKKVKVIEKDKERQLFQSAFEDFIPLECFVELNLKGRSVGAALLKKGKGRYSFVFGFKTLGLHDTLRDEQVEHNLDHIEAGLKELPSGESLTIHLSSFNDDKDRQFELSKLIDNTSSDRLKLLLMSEKSRAQQLKLSGVRRVKTLYLYATYTIDFNQKTSSDSDWIEKMLAKGQEFWESFKGNGSQVLQEKYETMLRRAFFEGYMRWEHLLNIKIGLDIKPFGVQDFWEVVYSKFHWAKPGKIPQYLKFSSGNLDEIINLETHASSVLVEGEFGQSNVPVADREWVKLKDKYVAALAMTAKPAGFLNGRDQLAYLWKVLCRPYVRDTEIVCQISTRNSTILKTDMQRILKQSNVAAELAERSHSIDVAAQIKVKRSVEAQEQLYEGAFPVNIATVFLVHRDTPEQLDEACAALSDCFQLPAKLVRETEITWRIWLQTLPLSWEKLMGAPYKRVLTYLTNEAPGLLPFSMTRPGDSQGLELIADDGGTPIHLDYIGEHRNIAIFGTTRSGKSVLVSGMMSQFLAAGYPIVALDYPRQDGSSTFTDYTRFLEPDAAYFDIRKESNNIMEKPDLRHLSDEDQQERFADYRSFLEGAIVTMVLPTTQQDVMLEQTVRSLIGRALTNFFKDPAINERYEIAISQGFGSNAWARMPTLFDFMEFCTPEALHLEERGGHIFSAQQQISLQLDYWLNSSSISQAIARPSSFPTDVQLLVFALRGLSNENEAAILSLSAYSASLRRALTSPKSLFFIDESPILFKFPTISNLIGRQCANGAKAGIRVFLSAQDPDTIVNSSAGSQIMQNMNTRMIGRIQPIAIDSFVRYLFYTRETISRNASESFFPRRSELYSNWLLDVDGVYTYCRYYPGEVQIAAVANNMDEQNARTLFLEKYKSDPLRGMAEFSKAYASAIRAGRRMESIVSTESINA